MKTKITYKDIKALSPCYDPVKYIPDNWSGTVVDILKMKRVPAKDRLWVAVRHQFLTDRQLRLYGLSCARMREKYSTDKRVKECNDVVERFLNGQATSAELSAAWVAWVAAESAAWVAWVAAESAAWVAWAAEENQVKALLKILKLKETK